jgi:Skp family chaperone for outer membrane proteins
VEILLEENKAESGTVGYVDVVKIFNIYSVSFKESFSKEVEERQKKVDELKKEINHYIAKKEKLETEYQIAKMLEEFYKNIQSSTQTIESASQLDSVSNSTDSTTLNLSSNSVSFSSSVLVQSTTSLSSLSGVVSSSNVYAVEEPYIVMPGVGKFPLSNYKFSISSSTLEISNAIAQLDQIISKLKNDISELKKKYDEELSKKASKENEKIFKKIYDAIEEVSREERVSIVIDKKSILFGRKTVDLTDKVIEKLRE